MQLEFSTTLPSARPTSIAFSGDEYAVVACKDAHVAVFQRDNAPSCTWSQLSVFNLKPESVASSAYLSSTLVAAWKSVPAFFSVVHSSTHMDIIDASTGRRVHHMTFPSHVHLMGLVAVDDNAMLMQDMQDGPLVLVVLGQNDLMVLDVDSLATTSVHAVPPQVSALPAFLAPSMTMHVERHASTALVRLVDNDVEFWRYPVTC
ncbi:hypothetical protein DYB37_001433 [Aphanomyces astaci]|uniref:Anaphase-promoting complex subunit 4 WD40 domain-containing protein n=1 Tax=Aphanomyces astaci TaxID=112090 RepID=A0A3R7AR28_APHAT|nr:hypothetical protein DYB35_002270 [Aphanomyces astaci]RHZ20997.1 hypothetical protein DYB37_001433 [Aphanomyces astaci]